MFSLIKQVFIVFLSLSSSFAPKFLSLNDEPCTVGPTLIYLNPVEFKHYSFMGGKVKRELRVASYDFRYTS